MKHKYLRRIFLNPPQTGQTSYILAEVEDSRKGEYKWGHYMLTIGDCRRRVQLEFFLGTKKARRQSLKKINLLIETLARFGHSLKTESELITAYEQAEKQPKKKVKNGPNSANVGSRKGR